MHHGRRYPPPVDMKPRRERERERVRLDAAFQRGNTVDTVHSFRTGEGEGNRILGRRFFGVEGGKRQSWKAGRPSLRSPIIFQPSNKAIRMLGCTRQLKERNEDDGGRRRPTAEREGMHRGSFPYNTRNAFKYGMPTHRLFQICR